MIDVGVEAQPAAEDGLVIRKVYAPPILLDMDIAEATAGTFGVISDGITVDS